MDKEKCCGTCKWSDKGIASDDYICVNADSGYCADWIEYNHYCEDWEERE